MRSTSFITNGPRDSAINLTPSALGWRPSDCIYFLRASSRGKFALYGGEKPGIQNHSEFLREIGKYRFEFGFELRPVVARRFETDQQHRQSLSVSGLQNSAKIGTSQVGPKSRATSRCLSQIHGQPRPHRVSATNRFSPARPPSVSPETPAFSSFCVDAVAVKPFLEDGNPVPLRGFSPKPWKRLSSKKSDNLLGTIFGKRCPGRVARISAAALRMAPAKTYIYAIGRVSEIGMAKNRF